MDEEGGGQEEQAGAGGLRDVGDDDGTGGVELGGISNEVAGQGRGGEGGDGELVVAAGDVAPAP